MNTKKLLSLLMCAALLLSFAGCEAQSSAADYRRAVKLAEKGELEQAYVLFEELGDYKDSAERMSKYGYTLAKTAMDEEEYETAAGYLEKLEGYKNSDKLLLRCNYELAGAAMEEGDTDRAMELYSELGDYEDSKEMVLECTYLKALDLFESEQYEDARAEFIALGEYKDSVHYSCACGMVIDPDRYIDSFIYGVNLRLSMEDVPLQFVETEPDERNSRKFEAVSEDGSLLKGFSLFIEFRHMSKVAASYSSPVINDVHVCSEMGRYDKNAFTRMLGSTVVAVSFVNCQLTGSDDYSGMLDEIAGLYAGGLGPDGAVMGNILSGSADYSGFALKYSMMTDKTLSSLNYDVYVPELTEKR